MNKLWFKAKSYGWGWTPATKEGWIVTVLFLVLTFVNSAGISQLSLLNRLPEASDFFLFYAFQTVLIVGLLVICYLKGEKPSWRWGDQPKKKKK
ncbi:hypothetical protein KBD71_01360 [Candidatus Woesebacteria bacterium]|nr:hypothetical protein [Candidatus Woesebacteria bacterium]